MFDVDGTLVKSFEFDEKCYIDAVYSVLGHQIDSDWLKYTHVTDSGILDQHLAEKGIVANKTTIHAKVKSAFVSNIKSHLAKEPAKPLRGAAEFIAYLARLNNVSLSIATGGWVETARLKLESAGIDIGGIPVASSSDHYSRIEIMRLALQKANVNGNHRVTYFGDAAWDKAACEKLGFNFVLVGSRIEYNQRLNDFLDVAKACELIGL